MRIACVQADVAYGDLGANLLKAEGYLEKLSKDGVDLVVFPEAFLTGYCVDSDADARHIAVETNAVQPLKEACDRLGITCIVGYAERAGGDVYNSAALIEPGEPIQVYRKTHLPELGLDKHVRAGDELDVFDTKLGKIGLLICFDMRFPEPTRVLALRGAEIVILPTNWPEGAETSAEHVAITRAAENRIFVATCNRVGEENGFRFIGRSKIVEPSGKVIASAGDHEEVLVADIDLAVARVKRNVNIPGKYETEVIASRRPELYREIVPAEDESEFTPVAPPIWV